MILRTWHGRTARADGDAYERFLIERAAPDYRSIDGLVDLSFSRRDEGDVSHFLLVTIWRSLDAVSQFAGVDPAAAKYYPEDDRYLLEKDPDAHNHVLFHRWSTDGPQGGSA